MIKFEYLQVQILIFWTMFFENIPFYTGKYKYRNWPNLLADSCRKLPMGGIVGVKNHENLPPS